MRILPRLAPWIPAAIVAAGFAALVVLFLRETDRWRRDAAALALHDLDGRSAVVASHLGASLASGNLRPACDLGVELRGKGVRLTVFSGPRGVVYDSLGGAAEPSGGFLYGERRASGPFEVRLGVPRERVFAPLDRARTGFRLAALAGGIGVVLVFVVTGLQRARIRELARLERFRREFVADVSHEIRTPLTGILGAVDMLGDGDLSAPVRERLLGMVRDESRRLDALVQSVLDLARLERDGESLDLAPCDLAELVREAVRRRGPEAERSGVRLDVSGCDAPVVATCDAARIERAVGNLVGNALRHSKSPEVMVSLARRGGAVEIAVEDRGVGVPPGEAERIFERFHRVDPARAAETGGAGLGLAIVRRIARLHGGEATCEPVEPHGSRFVLRLGLRPARPQRR